MKNLKQKIAFVVCVIMIMTSFTGCSGFLADPVSLMQPPGASGDLVGIEQELNDLGVDYTLSYPSGGNYRNAILIKDIDQDGESEAIVFYETTKKNVTTIHMNVLSKNNGEWKSDSDTTLTGVGIDRIEFADLCGDSSKEILVGEKMYNSNELQLDVYKYENSKITVVSQDKYTDYFVCDLGASKKDQILYFNITSEAINSAGDSSKAEVKQMVTAKLLSFSYQKDGVSTALGTVKFDSSITSFSKIAQSKINDQQNGVFVDAYKGSAAMITEVFYYHETLKKTFYNDLEGSTDTTTREALINSRDIDNDGRIEIPKSYLCHGYESVEDPENKVYFTEWLQYNGAALDKKVATGVLNITDKYFLKAPETWLGSVTIERNLDDRIRVFYDWNFDKSEKGTELFRIRVFNKSEFDETGKGYTEIKSNGNYVYGVKINNNNNSNNSISIDYIKENLETL